MSIKKRLICLLKEHSRLFTSQKIISILAGTAILSFGLYNIHQQVGITEGGVLGLILLLNYWIGITPAIVSPILDLVCYAIAFKSFGKDFLILSAVSSLSLAGFFFIWELFPPILPSLSDYPLIAAILGGVFVGVGVGLVTRQGGATGGDDALALTISKMTGLRVSLAYLFTDITVLVLSLSYIPVKRIGYSVVTVLISSVLIDFIKDFSFKQERKLRVAK